MSKLLFYLVPTPDHTPAVTNSVLTWCIPQPLGIWPNDNMKMPKNASASDRITLALWKHRRVEAMANAVISMLHRWVKCLFLLAYLVPIPDNAPTVIDSRPRWGVGKR